MENCLIRARYCGSMGLLALLYLVGFRNQMLYKVLLVDDKHIQAFKIKSDRVKFAWSYSSCTFSNHVFTPINFLFVFTARAKGFPRNLPSKTGKHFFSSTRWFPVVFVPTNFGKSYSTCLFSYDQPTSTDGKCTKLNYSLDRPGIKMLCWRSFKYSWVGN